MTAIRDLLFVCLILDIIAPIPSNKLLQSFVNKPHELSNKITKSNLLSVKYG